MKYLLLFALWCAGTFGEQDGPPRLGCEIFGSTTSCWVVSPALTGDASAPTPSTIEFLYDPLVTSVAVQTSSIWRTSATMDLALQGSLAYSETMNTTGAWAIPATNELLSSTGTPTVAISSTMATDSSGSTEETIVPDLSTDIVITTSGVASGDIGTVTQPSTGVSSDGPVSITASTGPATDPLPLTITPTGESFAINSTMAMDSSGSTEETIVPDLFTDIVITTSGVASGDIGTATQPSTGVGSDGPLSITASTGPATNPSPLTITPTGESIAINSTMAMDSSGSTEKSVVPDLSTDFAITTSGAASGDIETATITTLIGLDSHSLTAASTISPGVIDSTSSSAAVESLPETFTEIPGTESEVMPALTQEGNSLDASTTTSLGTTINAELTSPGMTTSSIAFTTDLGLSSHTVLDSTGTPASTVRAEESAARTGVLETATAASTNGNSIVKGPVTASREETIITSTLAVAPADFTPITVGNHAEWTSNTWITTTSEGSSDPTVVPVLVGCKKCGGSGSGIVIFGLPPIPHVRFELPELPSLSFACIPSPFTECNSGSDSKNGINDDDEEDGHNDKESFTTSDVSSTCTDTVTASDCLVTCNTYTGSVDNVQGPQCTTTCTKTHSGCSATGVTSTTSASGCSGTDGSCLACTRWPGMDFGDDASDEASDDEDSDDDTGEMKSRDVSGYQDRRRAKKNNGEVNNLGKCGVKGGPLRWPDYPGGYEVLSSDIEDTLKDEWKTKIDRWWVVDATLCLPDIKSVNAAEFQRIQLAEKTSRYPNRNQPTIDHIFEKSFLTDFFRVIVDDTVPSFVSSTVLAPVTTPATINCADLDYYIYDGVTETNRLQAVFDKYPSKDMYLDDFVGMSHFLNSDCKGDATNMLEGGVPVQNRKRGSDLDRLQARIESPRVLIPFDDFSVNIDASLLYLEKLYLGVKIWNEPLIVKALERQNQRIWQAFIELDDQMAGCGDPKGWSFADRYKDYMASKFTDINVATREAKEQIGSKIAVLLSSSNIPYAKDVGVKEMQENMVRGWQTRLTAAKSATYDVSIIWSWPPRRRSIVERQNGACTLRVSNFETMTTLSTSIIRTGASTTADVSSATASGSLGLCLFDIQCKVRLKCDEEEQPTCSKGFCVCKRKSTAAATVTFTVTQHTTSTLAIVRSSTNEAPSSPTAAPPAPAEITYDCKGLPGITCSGMKVKLCDEAVNNMQRGDHIYESGQVASYRSGNRAWGARDGPVCAVYIAGTRQDGQNCRITGDDMWWAYQDIRNSGCHICGRQHLGDGCMVVVASVNGYTWRS